MHPISNITSFYISVYTSVLPNTQQVSRRRYGRHKWKSLKSRNSGKIKKKIRSATIETISNKIVETELVDDSVTDIELSHESDMSEISLSVEEEISMNDNSNPLQHLYENDETWKISPSTLLEERLSFLCLKILIDGLEGYF